MESLGAPIEGLLAAMESFVRTPATKLLHVEAAPRMRKGCIEGVMAYERALANRAPFYLFEQEHTASSPGWSLRAEHARAQHAHRGERMDTDGESLPTLPEPEASGSEQARFASALLQLAQHLPEGAHGVIAVLSPSTLEGVEAWHGALRPLLVDRQLAAVRFVVIEASPGPTADLATQLRDRGAHVRVVPDAAAEDRDVESMLTGFDPAGPPPGASPALRAPPHPSAGPPPEPSADAQLRGSIARKLVDSALAMKRGEHAAAVQSTREARDLSAGAGLHRDAINLEMMLGGQLLGAGSPGLSESAFSRAIEAAEAKGEDAQVATGRFALGASKLTRQDRQGALVCYAEGTVAAERSGQTTLAVEGGRLTGALASDLGLQAQAIAFFTKAVKLAEALGPRAPFTSAGESARRLAKMCRDRGLNEQAESYEGTAARYEALVVPEDPTSIDDAASDDAAEPSISSLSVQDVDRLRASVEDAPEGDADLESRSEGDHPGLDEAALEKLRAATFDVLDEDSSSMLTREELAELAGVAPLQVPEQPAPAATPPAPAPQADLGFDLSKLEALRDAEIDDEEDGGATLHRRDAFDDE